MLGYTEGSPATISQLGTLETSTFAMDVQCTGNETSILECPQFTVENCETGKGAFQILLSGFFSTKGGRGNDFPLRGRYAKNMPMMCPRYAHAQQHRHRHRYKHIDTQTHRHTDTQTHRHTDTQTHRHTDT